MASFRLSPSFLRTSGTLADDLALATLEASGIAEIRPATSAPGRLLVHDATAAPLLPHVVRDATATAGQGTRHDGPAAAEVRALGVGDVTATSPPVRFRQLISPAAEVRIAVFNAALTAPVRLPRVGAGPAAVTRSDRRPVVEDTAATDLALHVIHLQRAAATTTAAVSRVYEVLPATATVVRR